MNVNPAADATSAPALAYGHRAQAELAGSILPFWWRTIDATHGGVLNCWNNAGTQLVSRDKFTWSQGRFAWLSARVAELGRRGCLAGPASPDAWLAQAEKTVVFIREHAVLPDGRCVFLLSQAGEVKEAFPGAGATPSIYADCFAVMGCAEFARVSGDRAALDLAWRIFGSLERRISDGDVPTHPEPIPDGYDSHAVAMITLNVLLVLRHACRDLADARLARAEDGVRSAATRIFDRFLLPGGRIAEHRARTGGLEDTLLSRHMNPGHALEGAWMLLTVAAEAGRSDWLARAAGAVQFQLERGWDEVHGGILHYVDCEGGPPRGAAGESQYERGVRATWDTKLWWVHSEALYTTALCHRLTGDAAAWTWFERLWAYTFRTFPNPDRTVGEWIQIRDRTGQPLERVVALPVKDPYHIVRNLIQLVELFVPPRSLSPS